MAGISDQKVIYVYTGGTLTVDVSTGVSRFRVPLPEFTVDHLWEVGATRVRVVKPTGEVAVYDADENPAAAAWWDANGEYLWITPPGPIPLTTAWRVHLLYRPVPQQNEDPTSLLDFSATGNAVQHDRNVRLAQVALEMARMGLVLPPEDEEFTGTQVPLQDRLLPRRADRALKVLAFDAAGNPVAAEMDPLELSLDLAGKADITYVDALVSAAVAAEAAIRAAQTGSSISTALLGQNILTLIVAAAAPRRWTSAVGALGTPEGTGTVVWNYLVEGDGSDCFVRAWKAGAAAADYMVITRANGTWAAAWMKPSTPPIGAKYRQSSDGLSPGTLYPGTTWTNISWKKAGAVSRTEGDSGNGNLSWVTFQSGIVPARFGVTVASGVPTITVVTGGSGYLSGGSGNLPLVIVGTCTTQMAAHATVVAGVLTAIVVDTPGAGYTTGSVGVYDEVARLSDRFMRHWHQTYTDAAGSAADFQAATTSVSGSTAVTVGNKVREPKSDGANGLPRVTFETVTAYTVEREWERTA